MTDHMHDAAQPKQETDWFDECSKQAGKAFHYWTALERIAIVCTQNMDRDKNHRMALDGVRQIANDYLDASQPSPAATVEDDRTLTQVVADIRALGIKMTDPHNDCSADSARPTRETAALAIINATREKHGLDKITWEFAALSTMHREDALRLADAVLALMPAVPQSVPQEEDCGCIGAVIGQHDRSCPLASQEQS